MRSYAGRPEDSGIALQTVMELGPDFPIFGVCMGHQCIGQVFGGDVVRAPSGVMHGKTSRVHHYDTGLLKVNSLFAMLTHESAWQLLHLGLITIHLANTVQSRVCCQLMQPFCLRWKLS